MQKSSEECEVTGKQHATLWRLTFTGTPAILRVLDALGVCPR
jgi:hypothetical protein